MRSILCELVSRDGREVLGGEGSAPSARRVAVDMGLINGSHVHDLSVSDESIAMALRQKRTREEDFIGWPSKIRRSRTEDFFSD